MDNEKSNYLSIHLYMKIPKEDRNALQTIETAFYSRIIQSIEKERNANFDELTFKFDELKNHPEKLHQYMQTHRHPFVVSLRHYQESKHHTSNIELILLYREEHKNEIKKALIDLELAFDELIIAKEDLESPVEHVSDPIHLK